MFKIHITILSEKSITNKKDEHVYITNRNNNACLSVCLYPSKAFRGQRPSTLLQDQYNLVELLPYLSRMDLLYIKRDFSFSSRSNHKNDFRRMISKYWMFLSKEISKLNPNQGKAYPLLINNSNKWECHPPPPGVVPINGSVP